MANQLIREDNEAANKTWIWTYDNAGNITSRTEYAYTDDSNPTGGTTIEYEYDHTNWGDLLTGYGDSTITSDSIGNMTAFNGWTFAWEHGRELASLSKDGTTWTNTYNADGLRTKRTNGSTTYQFVYNGSSLSQMTVGTHLLNFAYDASGSPMAVVYDGTTYYYVTNLQGDIVAILDSAGTAVVKYSYDAWGKPLTTSGAMATTLGVHNPLRYRGYVYDEETALYYLQSRYYDPVLGRFINADEYTSTGQGVLGYNMFTYCRNNPVNRLDESGSNEVWYLLKEYAQMGLIHYWVQTHIVENYVNTSMELWIYKGDRLVGRADIMHGNSVWEIKHGGSNIETIASRTILATLQASSYIGGRTARDARVVQKLGSAGAYGGSFTINVLGSSCEVSYCTPSYGVILYFVEKIEYQEDADYEFAFKTSKSRGSIMAAGAAGIGIGLGGGRFGESTTISNVFCLK